MSNIIEHLLHAKAGQNTYQVLAHSVLPIVFYNVATEAQIGVEISPRSQWWLNAGIKWPWWFDFSFAVTLDCFSWYKSLLSLCKKMGGHFQAYISLGAGEFVI